MDGLDVLSHSVLPTPNSSKSLFKVKKVWTLLVIFIVGGYDEGKRVLWYDLTGI